MKITFAGCSRTGLIRNLNEDAILMRSADGAALFLVADGIGGKEHGEIVSGMIRDGYDKWWNERILPEGNRLNFRDAVCEIKDIILQQNREVVGRFGEMTAGSTIVLLFLSHGNCLYLSSGDSRIYRARKLSVRQITVDDIYDNLKEKPMGFGPEASGKLVGAIGIRETPEFTVRTDTLQRGDRFFLCSDGVYRYIAQERLFRKILLGSIAPQRLVGGLSAEVERNGACDNYSMVSVHVNSA